MMPFDAASSLPSSATVPPEKPSVRVEKATSHLLISPDWTMNMDICDTVNNDQRQAKEVLKAVKKRLQNKHPKVQFLALTLLETMVKNCGDYVHFQIAERKILEEMIKIVKKKTDMQVRDKILMLLDSWQEAFGGPSGKYPQYYWAYTEMKKSGILFPQRSANTPPIFTPVMHSASTSRNAHAYGVPSAPSVRLDEVMSSDMGNLSLSDLSRIQDIMELLREMLQAVNPYDRQAMKDELIVELVNQCRSNQKRLMELISSTGDEKLLGEGLELYDGLQSLLAKRDSIASGTPSFPDPEVSKSVKQVKQQPIEPPLPPVVSTGFEDGNDIDDDGFAQLAQRNSKLKQVAFGDMTVNSSETLATNQNDKTIVIESSDMSSSAMSNALVPVDPPPPPPVSIQNEDMIDLLSITLSTYPSSPGQNESPLPIQGGHPQSFNPGANQGYTPYSSYVAPWAHQAIPPTPPPAQILPAPPQFSYYPGAVNLPGYSFQQQYNSFGSRLNNEISNVNIRQNGVSTSPKPYVLPNRLFEDLIDFRSSTTGQKISTRSPLSDTSSQQPMVGGKK
ncbi:hypothetical protein Cni_G15087 [Canna indica]|uniref:Uncharacterized protein n=1 Tax=Canna indica TaxID=4628 RepID=A0AAQ3KD62_9LILI|nr:hypothetical protein Cni_G15087 [Canna indica]